MDCTFFKSNTARDSDLDARVRREQVALLFASVPFSVAGVLMACLFLSYMFWEHLDHRLILGWLAGAVLVSSFRLAQYRRSRRQDPERLEVDHWWQQALLSALLSASIWAGAGLLLYPIDSLALQFFFLAILAGIYSGAAGTLSPVFPALVLFLAVTSLPVFWQFMRRGDETGLLLGILLLALLGVILQSARRLQKMIADTLTMRQEKAMAEATIRRQAYYDELTGLPNRRLLFDHLQRELDRSRRHGHLGALLFLDLDYFKNVNDSLGHAVGDRLLQQVARRLSQRLRSEDLVARLGGDEFVIVLAEVGNDPDRALTGVQRAAQNILDLFHRPFEVDGNTLHVSASMGVVLFPGKRAGSPGELLQQADVAMYRAKEEGRDAFRFFHPGMQRALERRLEIQRDLRQALDAGQMELYYQPQTDLQGNILGAEALVRWNHPEKGLIGPAEFIPVAEESGLIYPLGDWVITTACAHIRELATRRPMVLSVNISPQQFREAGFAQRIIEIVEQADIDPHLLHLEITESTMLENLEQTIAHMSLLKERGIGFSIDDFGTGYSSLTYLKRLPIGALKIDRSFVKDVPGDPNDEVLVETIIIMARHLGLEVIAEGVETREALEFLWRRGCRKFQGYLFSRPLPFEALARLEHPLLDRHLPAPAHRIRRV